MPEAAPAPGRGVTLGLRGMVPPAVTAVDADWERDVAARSQCDIGVDVGGLRVPLWTTNRAEQTTVETDPAGVGVP